MSGRKKPRFKKIGPKLPIGRPELRYRSADSRVIVELTWNAPKYVVTFSTIQAVRTTTIDAYPFTGAEPRRLAEVVGSPWLEKLARSVRRMDPDADFMEHSHHYFLLGYDEVLEVAAFEVDVQKVD